MNIRRVATHMDSDHSGKRTSLAATILLAVLAAWNTFYFTSIASTPLIQADGWYFSEHFISKYVEGSLRPLDFFMQRGIGDHAQPLQKLVLLWHTRYFGMDFRYEGMMGAFFAVLFCTLVALSARFDRSTTAEPSRWTTSILRGTLLGMVFVAGLSLNAINIYTWPLVTLGYIGFSLSVLFVLFLANRRRAPLVGAIPASFVLGMLQDELAIVFVVAFLLSYFLFGTGERKTKLKVSIGVVAGLALARLAMSWIGMRLNVNTSAVAASSHVLSLLQSDAGELLKIVTIPSGDGLIHAEHFEDGWYGFLQTDFIAWLSISVQIISIMVLGALWHKGHRGTQLLLVLFLLLTSYAITAGLVLNRVSDYGVDYLHQPRYVAVFQLPWMAFFLLMHYLSRSQCYYAHIRARAVSFGVIAVLFITLQVRLSISAWEKPPYIAEYWQNAANKMEDIRVNPNSDVSKCPDIIEPCTYSPLHRQEAVDFLAKYRLNLYSDSFRARHNLYPTHPTP